MKRWCPLCEEHTEVRLCGERIEDATGLGYACPDELCAKCGEEYE